jgi:hypothetical protein
VATLRSTRANCSRSAASALICGVPIVYGGHPDPNHRDRLCTFWPTLRGNHRFAQPWRNSRRRRQPASTPLQSGRLPADVLRRLICRTPPYGIQPGACEAVSRISTFRPFGNLSFSPLKTDNYQETLSCLDGPAPHTPNEAGVRSCTQKRIVTSQSWRRS